MQAQALPLAEKTVEFILCNMVDGEGLATSEINADQTFELRRTWRKGTKGPRAQADDYAFFIRGPFFIFQITPSVARIELWCIIGLLDLYEASAKEKYLMLAFKLQDKMNELFWDESDGGYFTSAANEHILLRSKDAQVRLHILFNQRS